MKILVVDDARWVHWVLNFHFNDRGVEVISAFTIAEAEAQFLANPDCRVILMDACVPGETVNTIELVKKMRKTFAGPIVAISSRPDYCRQLKEAGASHTASKEGEIEDFRQAVEATVVPLLK